MSSQAMLWAACWEIHHSPLMSLLTLTFTLTIPGFTTGFHNQSNLFTGANWTLKNRIKPFLAKADSSTGSLFMSICPIAAAIEYLHLQLAWYLVFSFSMINHWCLLSCVIFFNLLCLLQGGSRSFSGHSSCIGADTTATQQGLHAHSNKTVVWWSSDAYQLYGISGLLCNLSLPHKFVKLL